MTKLKNTIHLKGIRDVTASFPPKVWLDNKLLKLEKSLKVKSYSLQGFNWGKEERGAAQLALAVCLELYPPDIARKVYHEFKEQFLTSINSDGFSQQFDLSIFNHQKIIPLMSATD